MFIFEGDKREIKKRNSPYFLCFFCIIIIIRMANIHMVIYIEKKNIDCYADLAD